MRKFLVVHGLLAAADCVDTKADSRSQVEQEQGFMRGLYDFLESPRSSTCADSPFGP